MLRFYGIRFDNQGTPERFTLTFYLRESLHAGLQIFEHYNENCQKTLQAINGEINKLFQNSAVKNQVVGPFRLMVAKWFRTKDIINFVCRKNELYPCKLEVARVLNTPESIVEKWLRIESILLEKLSGLEQKAQEAELGNPESELNLILQMVGLFFLEQDDEPPPANLQLQFIRNQFPKIIWKKKDGFSAASNPFWLPQNPHCRISYLANRLTMRLSRLTGVVAQAKVPDELPLDLKRAQIVPPTGLAPVEPFSFYGSYPQELPDELRLEFEGDKNRDAQLSFLPETAAETLLSLQKIIQKLFRHDGVKHLMAIFRQLAERSAAGICEFDTEAHLRLITKEKRDGTYSDKQQTVLNGVLTTLFQLRVKRFWKQEDHPREISNPFILELCCDSAPGRSCFPIRKLLLDPIFCSSQDNPIRLGGHLTFVPKALFQENIQKHALLPALASFIAGVWLIDFHRDQGVMEKSTREIIEGGAFNVTPAHKYRLPGKLKSELAYMEEKCYIERYSLLEDKNGNPWDDRHRFSAPAAVVASITEKMQQNQLNLYPERLIA